MYLNLLFFKVYSFLTQSKILFVATIIAFWIKFNIVFFTYYQYTGTKIFFPIFGIILLLHIYKNLSKFSFQDIRLKWLIFFLLTYLIPIGHLFNVDVPNWSIYKKSCLAILSYAVLYLTVVFLIERKHKKFIIIICYVFSLIALLYGFLNIFGWYYLEGHTYLNYWAPNRICGILDNPNHSAAIYLTGIILSIIIGSFYKKYYFLFLLIIPFTYIIYYSKAITILICIISFPFFWIILLILNNYINLSRYFKLFWFLIFIFFILFHIAFEYNSFNMKQFLIKIDRAKSIQERHDFNKVAINTVSQNFLFGIGTGNHVQIEEFNKYKEYIFSVKNPLYYHIHATLLAVFVTNGIVGLLALLGLIIVSIKEFSRLYQKFPQYQNIILICFIFFLVIQLRSFFVFSLPTIVYWFSLLLPFLLEGLFIKNK